MLLARSVGRSVGWSVGQSVGRSVGRLVIGDFRARGRAFTYRKRKIGSLRGFIWRFGGFDWGPWGPRSQIYTPLAWMKWVEKKDGCHWRF